jgi:zinc-ribbon family
LILIWGFKSYVQLLGIVTFVCGNCHNPAAQRVVERIRKFTFFWIPLFTVKRQTLVTCTFCGTASVLSKEQSAALLSQGSASPATQTPASNELPASEH